MSISAAILRTLADAGRGVEDAIVIARAMERGDDAYTLFTLHDAFKKHRRGDDETALAIYEVALQINEANDARLNRPARDSYAGERDSNRARRAMPDAEWRRLRLFILERDEFACSYCGSEDDLTCDHIIPLVRGGTNDHHNLTTACRPCNSSKGDKSLEEWRGRVL